MDHVTRTELPVNGGFVHIYCCKLAAQPSLAAEYSMVLSEDELKKARSYRNAADKKRYITAHLFLRNTLSRYTGTAPASIRFIPSHYYERPLLSSGEVNFSLSYRGDWALLAISNLTIGADIEQYREIKNIDDFAVDFFSDKERQWLSAADNTEIKHSRFFKLWTLKEAYLKAISKGLSYPLTQFSILDEAHAGLILEFPSGLAAEWKMKPIHVAPGYAAAVAYKLS